MNDAEKLVQELERLHSQLQCHSIAERHDQIVRLMKGLACEGLTPTDEEQTAYQDYIAGRISFKELVPHLKNIPVKGQSK